MLNKIDIMGRLTADPELMNASSGNSYTRFTIACQRDFARNGEEKATDFIDCSAFGKTAEFISKYFNKGSMIIVSGRLTTGSYEKNGEKRKSVSVSVDNAYFGESKNAPSAPSSVDGYTNEQLATAKKALRELYNDSMNNDSTFAPISLSDDDDLPF